MEKQKMTIHRGLAELKLIDAKIEKQINELEPVGLNQKDGLVNKYVKKEEFSKAAESKYDSINDLIARKSAIKSAIVQANGVTKVKVNEVEMTIADAINQKATIVFKKKLINTLKTRLNSAVAQLNINNAAVEGNIQRILEATFGKENVKVTDKDVEAVRVPYMASNEFHLVDPLKVSEKIETLEKEVENFEAEVDAVLSEINAVTMIEA